MHKFNTSINNINCLVSICLLLLASCTSNNINDQKNTHWKSETASSEAGYQKIDYLKTAIKRLYSTNPDSAIFYYQRIINLYHKERMPYNEFDANLKLSELISFRKCDAVKAISYYNRALEIMIQYEEFENNNPYFYIDMGNMFYTNKLFPQAKKSYMRAINIAHEHKNNFAASVGQNNIGILFRTTGKYDSASIYFHRALLIRKKIIPLYEAQNYYYLAKLFAFKKVPDSILLYRNLGLEAIKRQTSTKIDTMIITTSASKALTQDMYVYDANILAIYYNNIKIYSLSIYYYKLALQRSKELMDDITSISYLFEIAKLYVTIQDDKNALEYAESTYHTALRFNNQEYVVKSTNLLSQLYNNNNNNSKANYYLRQNLNFIDSLDNSSVSLQRETDKILLITTQAEESLRTRLYNEKNGGKLIKLNFISLLIQSLLLISLCFPVIYIYRKRKNRKIKDLQQVNMSFANIEKERKNGSEHTSVINMLDKQLTILFDQEKIYTKKNLSLSDVAKILETNTTYLSQYINNNLNTNFNDYVNSYRVKDACNIFKNNSSLKYSIDQVSDMVGFGSRTTFYSTFKRLTGVTPAFFQKSVIENKEQSLDTDLNDI